MISRLCGAGQIALQVDVTTLGGTGLPQSIARPNGVSKAGELSCCTPWGFELIPQSSKFHPNARLLR